MSEEKEGKNRPTPEQIAKMKEGMMKGYNDNMAFLELQVKYEELQARLSEAIARQARAESMIAQIRATREEEPEVKDSVPSEEKKETIHRTLKTQP